MSEHRSKHIDPNAPSGPIVERVTLDHKGKPVTVAGSTHTTANIDGKWYVVDPRGEKLLQRPFDTEEDARHAAQDRNPDTPPEAA